MQTLQDQRVIVTGGNGGLGLGLVEALVERKAQVTVLARNADHLAQTQRKLGVNVVAGDITDQSLTESILRDLRPTIAVLNAGAVPHMAPLHEQSWEQFSAVWNTDVRAGLQWIQAAIALPLPRGSRVLVGSSGAAVAGSPLSGGYAGAKRMLWLMAHYANGVSSELDLDIKFQVLVPLQIVGETRLGHEAAQAYAKRKGITTEKFLAGFGKPLPPRQFGEHVVTILTDPKYATGTAFGIRGDSGITPLDAPPA
jgi:NAD(P)-dependent dehydrogenase (short-subunit alcohol dehydrogenase family)